MNFRVQVRCPLDFPVIKKKKKKITSRFKIKINCLTYAKLRFYIFKPLLFTLYQPMLLMFDCAKMSRSMHFVCTSLHLHTHWLAPSAVKGYSQSLWINTFLLPGNILRIQHINLLLLSLKKKAFLFWRSLGCSIFGLNITSMCCCLTAKDKGEKKLFGYSFVPLMQEDGRTLPDGTHELIIHKVRPAYPHHLL